jgi:hypothetical protein
MYRLLLVVCLFISNIASASDYITVTGSGKTFDIAKQQAFRKAIEYVVGATVLSDVETQNYQRIKDEIYIYSSGYVDDYKILKQENNNDIVTLLIQVSVSESKLKNRIISDGKTINNFDGEKQKDRVETYLDERNKAYQLLQKVLNGYPHKFYEINQPSYTIQLDSQNNPVINIPYELSVNYEYTKSLSEILKQISNCTPSRSEIAQRLFGHSIEPCISWIRIIGREPNTMFGGFQSDNYFNDINIINLFNNNLVKNEPRIIVEFYDVYNNYIYGTCLTPRFVWGDGSFYSNGVYNRIIIMGQKVERGVITIPLNIAFIDKISKMQLSVKSKNICHK